MEKSRLAPIEAATIHFAASIGGTLTGRGGAIQPASKGTSVTRPRVQTSSSSLHASNHISFFDHDLESLHAPT